MDGLHLDVYAEMLRQAGFEAAAADLEAPEPIAPPPARSPTPPPPLPSPASYMEYEPPQYLPSYTQLQHIKLERGFAPYRRQTHFQHHLDQLMGVGEPTPVSRKVLSLLRRAKLNVHAAFAYYRARAIVKRNGLGSHGYRQIFWALREMGGRVLQLTGEQEQAMKRDFEMLCEAFDRRRLRKNFLSYPVVIQLLLSKYNVTSYYKLPSVKDERKYARLMEMYRQLRFSLVMGSSSEQ